MFVGIYAEKIKIKKKSCQATGEEVIYMIQGLKIGKYRRRHQTTTIHVSITKHEDNSKMLKFSCKTSKEKRRGTTYALSSCMH
jgi:hypothetical protein